MNLTAEDAQNLLKELFADTIKELLEAEMNDVQFDVPRGRNNEFEPQIARKRQKNVTWIDD